LIIDCHAHVNAPKELYVYKNNLVSSHGAHGYNTPPISDELLAESTAQNIKLMDSVGTDVQFISPRPFQMMHAAKPAALVQHWTRVVNDTIHRVVTSRPDRLQGVCAMPQAMETDPKEWLPELDRCINELGFVGTLINPDPSEGMNGTPPMGDKYWYPVYEKMCDMDIPALVHSSGCCNGRESYSNHFITEESISILSLLNSEVFIDFPDLKIVIGHGGGSIPYQVGRWRAERLHPLFNKSVPLNESFDESLHRLNFDTCIHAKESLELLFSVCGAENCLFGTEKPGSGSAPNPETGRDFDDIKPLIEEISTLSKIQRDGIFEGNTRGLYNRFK
jgi:predicted TIM-barrel fold metal-dependent hydrolase